MPSTLLCILHRLHCRGRLQSCADALGDVNSLVPHAVQLSHLDCLVPSAPQLVSLPFFSRRHLMPIDRKFPMPACPYHPRERHARGNLFDPRKIRLWQCLEATEMRFCSGDMANRSFRFSRALESFKPALVLPFRLSFRHLFYMVLATLSPAILDTSSTRSL